MTRRSSEATAATTIPAPDRYAITLSDEFFFALEGRWVHATGDTWQIEVCGVHATPSQYWLQLYLRGPFSQGLTLRVPRLDVGYVLDLVRDWLDGTLPAALEPSVTGRAYLPVLTN